MMKTVCVAAVVLSLFAVGQPAPLACEQLLKPSNDVSDRDLSGLWHLKALTMENCWYSLLMNSVFGQSVSFDILSTVPSNTYKVNLNVNIHGNCFNTTEELRAIFPAVIKVEEGTLLQTSCPDCLIIWNQPTYNEKSLMLMSRRKNITDAELKEFEKTVECVGWPKPLLYDADNEKCKRRLENDQQFSKTTSVQERQELAVSFVLKLRNMYMDIISCIYSST